MRHAVEEALAALQHDWTLHRTHKLGSWCATPVVQQHTKLPSANHQAHPRCNTRVRSWEQALQNAKSKAAIAMHVSYHTVPAAPAQLLLRTTVGYWQWQTQPLSLRCWYTTCWMHQRRRRRRQQGMTGGLQLRSREALLLPLQACVQQLLLSAYSPRPLALPRQSRTCQ